MDLYVLEHGHEDVSFFGGTAVKTDIDIQAGLKVVDATDQSQSKSFIYNGYCSPSGSTYTAGHACCYWNVVNGNWAAGKPVTLALEGERVAGGTWTHYCEYDASDSTATTICTQLYNQGWQHGDLFF